jgi:hypothetical protein
MELIDLRTADGSRQFAVMPGGISWAALCRHVAGLEGAEVTGFLPPGPVPGRIEFRYGGHRFQVRAENGHLVYLVSDPACPDLTVFRVAAHCAELRGHGLLDGCPLIG